MRSCSPDGAHVVVNDIGGSIKGVGARSRTSIHRRRRDHRRGWGRERRHERRGDHGRRAGPHSGSTRAVRRPRHPDHERRHHQMGGLSGSRRRQSREPSRRACGRLVSHGSRRVATHGGAGLRPHRHDDVDGMFGLPNNLSYATAKAAVIGLARSLTTAGAAHGIKVNLVAPAAVTRMAGQPTDEEASPGRGPAATPMSPDLVAPMVAFLPTRPVRSAARSTPPGQAASHAHLHRLDRGLPPLGAGSDDRGHRPALGRRSTTRPATTSQPI